MNKKILFFRREPGDGGASAESWYLVREADGSYWVEHARETAGRAEPIATVRIGYFFAQTEDAQLLRELRKALARAVM